MGLWDRIAFWRGKTIALPEAELRRAIEDGGRTEIARHNGHSIKAADPYSARIMKGLIADLRNGSFGASLLMGAIERGGLSPRRGTQELMVAYRRLPNLRNVVGRIAASVAAVQWRLYATPAGSKKTIARRFKTHDPIERRLRVKEAIAREELREIEVHPLLGLLDNMNPEHTGVAGRRLVQIHLELKGETFLAIERTRLGVPAELWPIPPHWIIRVPQINYPFFQVSYLGIHMEIPEDDMVWIKDPDPENPYSRGQGIGESLSDELDADEFAAKHMKQWFVNRGIPSMMIGVTGAEDEELDVAEQRWVEKNRGPNRAGRIHFHNGELSAVRLDDKFSDMELVVLRKFEGDIVQQTFNVPPELVGKLDSSNKATIQHAIEIFGSIVVVPRLEFLRAEYQQRLLPQFPQSERLWIEYDDPIPADRAAEMEAAKDQPYTLRVDEWRKMQGQPPLENDEGQVFPVPMNMQFVKSLGDDAGPRPATPTPGEGPITGKPPTGGAPPAKPSPDVQGEGDADGKPGKGSKSRRVKMTDPDVESALGALDPVAMSDETDPVMAELVARFGADAMTEVGSALSFSMINPLIIQHLAEQSGDRIRGITDTTEESIRNALIEGSSLGEGMDDLANRVKDVFAAADDWRATNIARTEVMRSSNFARWQGQAQTGVVTERAWLTTLDGRERDAHRDMQGQRRAISAPFTAPSSAGKDAGSTAMYPGGFPSAAMSCQCRCTTIPIVDGKDVSPDVALIWRSFDRQSARYEKKVRAAVCRGFAKQKAAILTRLEHHATYGGHGGRT